MPTIEAPIVAVTVYTDRARVTRRGSAHLAAGEQTLTLGGLPTTLQADSVRASGRGTNVRILGVEVAAQYVTDAPETNVAEVQAQLETLQDQDRALADDQAGVEARLAFLKSLADAGSARLARGLAAGQATIDTVGALSQYLAQEQATAAARRRELDGQRRVLSREIAALQARLNALQPARPYERREIRVTVEATAETDLELDVLYGVTGASWAPLYDVRLVESKVTVTYLAGISQRSGEDWPAVDLALSTARPAVSATLPKLNPWYVDTYRPPAAYGGGAPAGMAMPAPAPMQAASRARADTEALAPQAPPPPPAEIAQATIESTGAAVTYRVARPVAVPSDGAPHKTTITVLDLDARLDYLTVPKLAAEAYLRAKITNTSAFIFLPGAASIFHGADFVGTTALKTVVPGEEFEVQLGVDDRVKVERELTERTTSKAAIIGNSLRLLFGYQITLTSHLAAPAHITVFDQVPVSRQEEIKVRLQEATPKLSDQSDLNILKWEFDLPPQAKQMLAFTFTVEYPRTLTVTGLPQ